jgi:hypothetical protein
VSSADSAGSSDLRHPPVAFDRRTRVEDFARDWLASKRGKIAASTHALYETQLRLHLFPEFGTWKLAEVTPDALAEWISDKLDDYKPNTVHNMTVPVNGMFRRAVREGADRVEPVRGAGAGRASVAYEVGSSDLVGG